MRPLPSLLGCRRRSADGTDTRRVSQRTLASVVLYDFIAATTQGAQTAVPDRRHKRLQFGRFWCTGRALIQLPPRTSWGEPDRRPGLRKAAITFLPEARRVLTARGVIREQPSGFLALERDWRFGDLEAVKGYTELLEVADAIEVPRCGSGHSIVWSLMVAWLSPRWRPPSLRKLVDRWLDALAAPEWLEYHAVGFSRLEISRAVRLGSTVRLAPSRVTRIPMPETLDDAESVDSVYPERPKTWALLRERTINRYPSASIRVYPFPAALTDALALVASPLLEADLSVDWDGPSPLATPSFLPGHTLLDRGLALKGTFRLERTKEAELRSLYARFEQRRNRDAWRGFGSLPAEADRIQIALVYLQKGVQEANVFESHVSLATCFEALAGPKNSQDISRRVSGRIALLAGVNDEDIGDVFEHVRAVYDLRSRVLHTGTVLDRDAARIRNRMLPPLLSGAPQIDGGAFSAPLFVSLEIARRAIIGALRIELIRGEAFDPERLDRAELAISGDRPD